MTFKEMEKELRKAVKDVKSQELRLKELELKVMDVKEKIDEIKDPLSELMSGLMDRVLTHERVALYNEEEFRKAVELLKEKQAALTEYNDLNAEICKLRIDIGTNINLAKIKSLESLSKISDEDLKNENTKEKIDVSKAMEEIDDLLDVMD